MIRPTAPSERAETARAIARYVLPVPAGPTANVTVRAADRVDVALLVDGLRSDLLAAVAPDDVLEDVADVLRLVDRREHGADRVRPDLVASLDELDELVDDRPRRGHVLVVAAERQPVPAQGDRAAEPLAERVEDAVLDPRELGRDLVRDVQHLLHGQCRGQAAREPCLCAPAGATSGELSP